MHGLAGCVASFINTLLIRTSQSQKYVSIAYESDGLYRLKVLDNQQHIKECLCQCLIGRLYNKEGVHALCRTHKAGLKGKSVQTSVAYLQCLRVS